MWSHTKQLQATMNHKYCQSEDEMNMIGSHISLGLKIKKQHKKLLNTTKYDFKPRKTYPHPPVVR